uniref:NADH dehydrogenase subunit 2 n=1 Tax=Nymphon australe TaxID=136201 RepID=UPI00226D17B8|nr:NADH dehydrogenase subunit 2 [Nymphon australe]UZA61079.1 NADH dehydrogenase subunit 2 [Nymphon australe]
MMLISWINILTLSFIIIISISIAMSTNSPLPIWFSMELNTSAIIPILSMTNNKDKGIVMKYQIINSFAALIFIFSALNMEVYSMNEKNFQILSLIMMSSMIIKLGMFPFLFWFISLMKNMNWYAIFLMTSIQKIIPMIILIWMEMKMSILMILSVTIVNVIIAAIGTLMYNSSKMIMAFSSISYSSWMVMIMINNTSIWMISMMIYLMNMMLTTKILNYKNFNFLNKTSKTKNIMLTIILLNLGGLPPMAGFAMKIIILKFIMSVMSSILLITSMIFMSSTLIILFSYLKMIISSMMKTSINMIWINNININPMMKLIISLMLILPLITLW